MSEEIPPLRRYEIRQRRRLIVQAHYSLLGPEKAARIRKSGDTWPNGGRGSPKWRADYELDLNASEGRVVITAWDRAQNIATMPIPAGGTHVLSFDFGATSSSNMAVTATALGPKFNYTYFEYSASGAPARVHKTRIREGLRQVRPGLEYSFDWRTLFFAIGDVSGVGYKVEFADDPFPLHIAAPSTETGWRGREGEDGSEAILNGFMDAAKRCCFRQYDHADERCEVCKAELSFNRGWIVDPRCVHLANQIPAQVVDEDGKRRKDGRDLFDTVMYAARYAATARPRLAAAADVQKHPWWLSKDEPVAVSESIARFVNGTPDDVSRFF